CSCLSSLGTERPRTASAGTLPAGSGVPERAASGCVGAGAGTRGAFDPLAQVEPVRRAEPLGHLRIGVLGVEDVAVEVAADRDGLEVGLDAGECVRGKLRLADGVVLELQLRSELHELRPIRTRT